MVVCSRTTPTRAPTAAKAMTRSDTAAHVREGPVPAEVGDHLVDLVGLLAWTGAVGVVVAELLEGIGPPVDLPPRQSERRDDQEGNEDSGPQRRLKENLRDRLTPEGPGRPFPVLATMPAATPVTATTATDGQERCGGNLLNLPGGLRAWNREFVGIGCLVLVGIGPSLSHHELRGGDGASVPE